MTGPTITLVRIDHAAGGYLHGLTQPFLKARLRFDLPASMDWAQIDAALQAAIPVEGDAPPAFDDASPMEAAIQRLIHWTAALQRHASQPVFETGRVLARGGAGGRVAVLALPAIDPDIAPPALNVVMALIKGGPSAEPLAAARREIDRLKALGAERGISASMNRFLAAAHSRRIPWRRLSGKIFQIGHGARSRWLNSSFTDATSALGAGLARDKAATAQVLRQAGIPVPDHHLAKDVEAAVRAAEMLGYPVVVKPMDQDGGHGVFAGLKSPDQVRKAFAEARKYSENVLVETFVEGRDYRMIVVQGRLAFAVERIPGGVVGDGISTVRQLVDRQNSAPPPHLGGKGTLYRLNFDDEAVDLLAERGLNGDSVPADGLRIRLRSAANVASGGLAEAVFDQVHPDNARLSERAVRALNLDVAGLDLLIPDIARSWMETGAGVCEVNAQPSFTPLSAHINGLIVESLVQGQGRIPIAVIVGPPPGSQACRIVARMLAAASLTPGTATPNGVWIGAHQVVAGPVDAFTGARVLIADRTVQAAVIAVGDAAALTTGLPFDRCAVIALAGSRLAGAPQAETFDDLVRALSPMAGAKVVINRGDPACMAYAPRIAGREVILYAPEAAVDGLAQGQGAIACSAEDAALAVAVARALGCGEAHLRQGLAGFRLHTNASAPGSPAPDGPYGMARS
jgi:cyanophycin synthetase